MTLAAWSRWTRAATIIVVAVAIWLVVHELRHFTIDQVLGSLRAVTPHRLILAAIYTGLSYLALTGFDYLGVRYAGWRLAYGRIALASFVSLSIGHTVGLAPLSSGAIRYRFYSRWGLRAVDIVKVVTISAVTVALGETAVAAAALLGRCSEAARVLDLPPGLVLLAGIGCVTALAAYVGAALLWRAPFRVFRQSIKLPGWRLAIGQIVIGTINYALVTAALQQALGPAAIDYPTVATAYILANLAALASHVPGGLGVIETVVITLLPNVSAIGGLVAFRAVYFLVPLAIGTLVFAATELLPFITRVRGAPRVAAASERSSAE
jgi:uncharacterized membrane protein YbhN (UPF0104 family)